MGSPLTASAPLDGLGAVSTAGDFNDDGVNDVIVGAPDADPGGVTAAGQAYVVFGSATGLPASINLSDLNIDTGFVINGIDAGDRTGVSVSSAGDVNGDDIDDVIIGAEYSGAAYVVFGSATGLPASINLSDLNVDTGFVISGITNDDRLGFSVSGAGDINGDCVDDIIIGSLNADPNGIADAGAAIVVFGNATGLPASLSVSDLTGGNGFVINGIDSLDLLGLSASGAGDVNGDGVDDVIIGARDADPNGATDAGEAYVVFGRLIEFTVNSIADDSDATPLGDGTVDVDLATPGYQITLRAAIEEANALSGTQVIAFDIPGDGPHAIQPTSALPTITDTIVIDGYTQPGATPNSLAIGSNAVLQIELDGSQAGIEVSGLVLEGDEITVRGLSITGFDEYGILVDETTNGSAIEGCYLGPDASGAATNGNEYGVKLQGTGTRLGTDGDGTNDAAERNVISGNQMDGITLRYASGVIVAGNYVGTSPSGTAALPNARYGIQGSAIDSRIGTNADGVSDQLERNVISGNTNSGVSLQTATNSMFAGNFVGTDATGLSPLGNGLHGVYMVGTDDFVVGTNGDGVGDALEGNVISANGHTGVALDGTYTYRNVIAGNIVGLDVTGTQVMGNAARGIVLGLGPSWTQIGTNGDGLSDELERNIIANNSWGGIAITGYNFNDRWSSHNVVAGNYVGTDITGTIALGNGSGQGIKVTGDSRDNLIGSDLDGFADGAEANRIAGHATWGMTLGKINEYGSPSSTTIAGNVITSNTLGGVAVGGDTIGTQVTQNSIHSNDGPAIDLVPNNTYGITDNDPADIDTGPNQLQNFPVLTSALSGTGSTLVQGTLNSTPDTTLTLEFFANSDLDPTGYGEGEDFLGSVQVTTDSSGNAVFAAGFSVETPVGQWLTATATDPTGNTSEFSLAESVSAALVVNTTDDVDDGVFDAAHGSLREAILAANATRGHRYDRLPHPGDGCPDRSSPQRPCR